MVIIDGVTEDVADRIKRFFKCFIDMDEGTDVTILGGAGGILGEKPEATIVIDLSGKQFPFSTAQARMIAKIAENALGKYPVSGLPNLILGLRYGADEADRLFEEEP